MDSATIRQRVRATAVWAGIGAALLLYFGYTYIFFSSDEPAARIGTVILQNTLQLGGWALVVATVGLAVGMRQALIYDAVVTALIGLCFVTGGVLWLVAGVGFQGLLYVVFGVVFVSAGRNSWREYAWVSAAAAVPSVAGGESAVWTPEEAAPPSPPTGSLAGRLMERTRGAAEAPPPSESPSAPEAPEPAAPAPPDDEPPPEGYLARFAERDRSRGESSSP